MAKAGGITNAVNVGIAVQADWENREFISHISLNVRRLFEFLVQFEPSPLHTTTIVEKCTPKLVNDYKHMLCQATEPCLPF